MSMASKAGSVAEGGAVNLETYQWAFRGSRTTPEDAGYEAQKEPKAQLDNDWNYSTREDLELINWQAGENARNISDLESRLSNLESTVSDLETRYEGHNHDDRYYTELEADNRFLTETEGDGLYYPRTEADNTFLTEATADNLYYPRATADDRFVDEGGDTMSGPLTMNADLNVGVIRGPTVSGFISVRGSDIEGDTTAQFSWEQKKEQPLRVYDRYTSSRIFDITRAGGAVFTGGVVNTAQSDTIALPNHTGSDPSIPNDGNIHLWSRSDIV